MMYNLFEKTGPKPKIIGAGLIALDVIINGDDRGQPQLRMGGSCGNVLTILSYLGWQSYPIARFNEDETAKMIIDDMKRWGVDTSLITQNQSGSTPIIVEKIQKKRDGEPTHRFSWKCPCCGSLLPRYQPVLKKDIPSIIEKMPNASVFYFDRVSRSSIEFAKENKKRGALIFFEPCSIKDKKQFFECLELSDIVKYSSDNGIHSQNILKKVDVSLEIKTLGSEGLSFHLKNPDAGRVKRGHMNAYPVDGLKDTAGAGDWCSAGIIHLLGREGAKSLETIDESAIKEALRFGQVLAALSCQFEGARGVMYHISKTDFQSLLRDLANNRRALELRDEKRKEREGTSKEAYYCPDCYHLISS